MKSLDASTRADIARVDLVEFGDYECPYCREAHPIVKHLRQRFGETLHFRFRNFPLSEIHPHAEHAAEAAVSVRSQVGDKGFWLMHDTIFAHQGDGADALDDEHLAAYADAVGADSARVLSDLDNGKFEETVGVDLVEGIEMGVSATPTFFINGKRFEGDWRDIEQLATAIENAALSNQGSRFAEATKDKPVPPSHSTAAPVFRSWV